MIFMLKLAFRNALRNARRTLLTAATVAIGTAFVVVTLSFLGGLFDGMLVSWTEINGPVRIVTKAYADREQLRPLHENIEQSAPLIADLETLPGATSVVPMIRTGVGITLGEELGEDGAMLTGTTRAFYDAHLLPTVEFSGGKWLDYDSKSEQVVLGSKVARDTGARVGDEILLMGVTQYGSMAPISADVVGVISGNTSVESQAYVTLEVARWMIDVPDGALEILIYGEDVSSKSEATALAAAARSKLDDTYEVTAWHQRGIWIQMLPVIDGMNYIISGIIVFVMALAIFNTMTMSVLERTGEIGVMRALGQSRLGAVFSFLLESMMIGLFGGLLGAVLGAIPAFYLEQNGISYTAEVLDEMGGEYPMTTTMYADLSPDVLAIALFVGVLTAILGAALPSIRAARIPPFEAMKQR